MMLIVLKWLIMGKVVYKVYRVYILLIGCRVCWILLGGI